MKIITAFIFLMGLCGVARADDKCGKLTLFDTVHLTRSEGQDLIPVSINGEPKNFILDTGAYFTQVARPVVEELKLPMLQGNFEMFDLAGNISRDVASVKEFQVAHMRGHDLQFPVSPIPAKIEGLLALDHFTTMDMDVDFGTDTLSLFTQDHCEGAIQYWPGPPPGVLPFTLNGYHVVVPVMLDGHEERALIDTGAGTTIINQAEEDRVFGLHLGDTDTPERGVLNGDATLKTYTHRFKTLSFGDVAVTNPMVRIIPNAVGRNAEKAQLVGDRAKSEKDLIQKQDMIIGMDVLRKLHLYIAFGERKIYVAPASAPAPAAKAGP
jgi:predicted aspartyl protease